MRSVSVESPLRLRHQEYQRVRCKWRLRRWTLLVLLLTFWRVCEGVLRHCCSLPRRRSARSSSRWLWVVEVELSMQKLVLPAKSVSQPAGESLPMSSVAELKQELRLELQVADCLRRGCRASWPTRSTRRNAPFRWLSPSAWRSQGGPRRSRTAARRAHCRTASPLSKPRDRWWCK